MIEKTYNVLFLCTGNSARSILAEALVEHWGKGRFYGFSAGSFPKGIVQPLALDLLERLHIRKSGLWSKSWDEFARPGAPSWISFSRSAIRQQARSARFGPATRSRPIGAYRTRRRWRARMPSADRHSALPTGNLKPVSSYSSPYP